MVLCLLSERPVRFPYAGVRSKVRALGTDNGQLGIPIPIAAAAWRETYCTELNGVVP